MKNILTIVFAMAMIFNFFLPAYGYSGERLFIFAGAASKPPTEEIVKLFEVKTGVKVDVTFGGSGYVLSQMLFSQAGDIYFPGSSDYMEKAKREGLVFPETEKIVVYLVPAINVQKGNPKQIKGLKDLIRDDIKVAIANPEGVCVGAYAVELIEKWFSPEEKRKFRENLLNYTASCDSTATAISLKTVDVVIGWSVFQYWDEKRIETVPLKNAEIIRIGYIPIAISKFTKNIDLARKFIDFIISEEAQAVFKKHHYFTSKNDVLGQVGTKPVGGEYLVPDEWIQK